MQVVINLDQQQQNANALLEALIRFSVRAGAPRCYQNWSPETLRDYFCFHARQGTLAWTAGKSTVHSPQSKVLGTAVAWQVSEAALRAGEAEGGYRFDWTPQDRAGDCVFFGDIVCTTPAALVCLLADFGQRFPQWRTLKWFTYRRGKLVRLQPRHLKLFLRKTHTYVER